MARSSSFFSLKDTQFQRTGVVNNRFIQGLTPRQIRERVAVILGLTALYAISFVLFVKPIGPVEAALISIPVAIAGWYFGVIVGVISAIVGIVLTAVMFAPFNGGHWLSGIVSFWPGYSMVLLVGYIAGSVRNELDKRALALEEMRSQERYLALVNLATQNILDSSNLGDTYYYLVNNLAHLFDADYADLFRWDARHKQAILVASTIPLEQNLAEVELDLSESGIIVSALRTGNALIVEDMLQSEFLIRSSLDADRPPSIRSVLCIPILVGEAKLGAMIIAYNTPRTFSAKEINYAELAGNQIALALRTIEQDIEIRKRLKEANALATIEHVLSETERVGIGTILQLIVDSARDLIPEVESAVLHMVDDEQKVLIPRAAAGFETGQPSDLKMHLGEGAAGQAILTGEVINIVDTHSDSRFVNVAEPTKFRSLLVAPIQSNERCVGTISIQNKRPNAFTAEDEKLLGALGTQAAIAIENANLLQTTQQDLKEINALYHVSRGLAASLDPDELMKEVADLLQHNFDYYHVQIFVVDPQSGDLVSKHETGKSMAQRTREEYRLDVGMGIVGHVAETGNAFVTNDVDGVVFFLRNPLLPDTQSELTVPIKVNNQVVGVLDIQQRPPDRLTGRDLQLMTGVADQLAVALQKANLYSELQNSLNQEKETRLQLMQSERLAVAGRLLASVSHELNNPLQAIQNALFLIQEEEKLSAEGRQDLDIVLSETERMAMLLNRLRATYRSTRVEDFQDIDLNMIIEDVKNLTATYMRHNDIRFEFQPEADLPPALGIPDQIRQVILNLFVNAMDAMKAGGQITVCTRNLPDQGKVLFSIADTGPGIDDRILPHIFEPFITDKENGTGLGLAISNDIIHRHNGDIQAGNDPAGGAVFKFWLPVYRKD